ncbi:MarR family winged helix-turn-helix transcriptional regulator [Desulfofustis glycolicus]|uniref:DNA-binding transcriptional regulator, MarR family n=1 Tax=Desulfofustis glycolicus DSM 9705 TaxID=1121409 RepID=A0A1M5WS55_9BACT|nr:MarR family transcriptional regulator [Desulfofustis glycolicus]MCB2218337.1 MarR family transcriptional regulator [Desulfobulbaceae bacterium]SHH89944.1 DNA-binding transcriptional regulator, MarR family [Desulfofustis glycolicus DSM 9705]
MSTRTTHIHEITRDLRILFRSIQAHAKHVETTCGLSGAKLWMLYEINANPGIKVSELAAALTIHPSTCSNMLDKLEQQGLINRDRSGRDQRSVHLSLTKQGESLLSQAPQPAQGELSRALQRLSDKHLATLHSGLAGLVEVLNGTGEDDDLLPIPED